MTAATNTARPKIVFFPTSLDGETYRAYRFRARVDGVADENLSMHWDFGPMMPALRNVVSRAAVDVDPIVFGNPGSYQIVVQTRDKFTDTLVAIDSLPVVISASATSLRLIPHGIDTVSATPEAITFPITMIPTPRDLAPGMKFLFRSDGPDRLRYDTLATPTLQFNCSGWGTSHIQFTLHDTSGTFSANDSMTITVRPPVPPVSTIRGYRTSTVYVMLDTATAASIGDGSHDLLTASIMQSQLNPMALRWQGQRFDFPIDRDIGATAFHEHWHGVLSDDGRSLDSLVVEVNDSTIENPKTGRVMHPGPCWSVHVEGLQLVATQAGAVVYGFFDPPYSTMLKGLTYVRGLTTGGINYANSLYKAPQRNHAPLIFFLFTP